MQRRSRSKMTVKQNGYHQKSKNQLKGDKMQEQVSANERVKLLKENFLISLANVFLENKNDPSLIYPWMKDFRQLQEKIIGRNYVIQGPSQSGKYSSVKYAIEQNHAGIKEILINCDVSTTEHQIYQRIIDEFITKCDSQKCKWPSKQQISKIFQPQNIDFQKINPYLIRGKVYFVIVVRNAQHLFGFKNQSILYNLFQWMRSQEISQRGGLVLISRQLRLTDKFQKRVKSRFCGTRLCIFRPQKSQIYTKIITKRIQAVISDKQAWVDDYKKLFPQSQMINEDNIYDSDEDMNTKSKKKGRTPKKASQPQKNITFEEIVQNKDQSQYVKQMDEYITSLQTFLGLEVFHELQINQQLIQTVMQISRLKSKKKDSEVFSQESVLKPEQQIECLKKLKSAFENNKQLEYYIEQKIMNNQIITIPFILMVLQHIFIRLDETLVKNLPLDKLKKLILILFEKNVQYQFPTHDIEGNSLQNLNNVEIMFLTLIYTWISQGRSPVKLTLIYDAYKQQINPQIHDTCNRSSNTLPLLLIQRSIQNLWRNRIITYDLYNLWNSDLKLVYSLSKTKLGLQMVASRREITQIMKTLFQNANIFADYKLKVNKK